MLLWPGHTKIDIDEAWTNSWQRSMDNWLSAAQTAIALDPSDAQAHAAFATYYMYIGDFDRALAEFERAVSLNPNDGEVLMNAAANYPWLGKPERALETIERAMRLNPHFPEWYYNPVRSGAYFTGQYQRAIATVNKKTNRVSMTICSSQ